MTLSGSLLRNDTNIMAKSNQKSAALVHKPDQDALSCFGLSIRCFNSVSDISADWPTATQATTHIPSNPQYHVFQTTTFLNVWAQTYAPALKAQICLVEVRNLASEPVLFLPLTIIPRNGIRLLSFTDQGVADYNAPVLFDCGIEWTRMRAENLWQQIIKALPAFDFADFENMPETIGSLVNPLFLLANRENLANSHATSLKPSWPEIEKQLERPRRTRMKLRRLQELGDCTFAVATNTEERQAYLEFMLYQKQQRFIETDVPGFETHPEKMDYFRVATEAFHEAGVLHLSALKLNNEIIACMWGLIRGPHYYGIMIASNLKNWAKYSPGNIMHYILLKHLKEHNYDCLDLGVGDEDWKLKNCDLTIPLMRMTHRATWRGHIYEIRQNTMASLRGTAFWKALRPLKWRIIRTFKRG